MLVFLAAVVVISACLRFTWVYECSGKVVAGTTKGVNISRINVRHFLPAFAICGQSFLIDVLTNSPLNPVCLRGIWYTICEHGIRLSFACRLMYLSSLYLCNQRRPTPMLYDKAAFLYCVLLLAFFNA
uniref:Uncharacterized protein n=1 Tax=Trypanosoma vivax (strain Y486) TaxID=1055687 RepID=G0U4L5_TRYVY|nr:hypothetical protein TVY486_1014220 [Trypanosoma vivax Y486]